MKGPIARVVGQFELIPERNSNNVVLKPSNYTFMAAEYASICEQKYVFMLFILISFWEKHKNQ